MDVLLEARSFPRASPLKTVPAKIEKSLFLSLAFEEQHGFLKVLKSRPSLPFSYKSSKTCYSPG